MKDAIGDRMKNFYEGRSRIELPRKAYTLLRIDGKSFKNYTRNLKRPFDDDLMEDMDLTAAYLCKNIMGAKFAFVQSDEISILLTDFEEITTQAWFDNNLQKMCSISASMATSKFNQLRMQRFQDFNFKSAEFDSRVFQIPSKSEVENYFNWRQKDTTRNSISSVAQSLYSHSQLNGKNTDQMQELIFQKGINWDKYKPKYKRGRLITKETFEKKADNSTKKSANSIRTRWVSTEVPVFTKDKNFLKNIIPDNL